MAFAKFKVEYVLGMDGTPTLRLYERDSRWCRWEYVDSNFIDLVNPVEVALKRFVAVIHKKQKNKDWDKHAPILLDINGGII